MREHMFLCTTYEVLYCLHRDKPVLFMKTKTRVSRCDLCAIRYEWFFSSMTSSMNAWRLRSGNIVLSMVHWLDVTTQTKCNMLLHNLGIKYPILK